MRRYAIPVLLLVLVVLVWGWQSLRLHQNEHRLAVVAAAVSHRDVGVSCPGFWTRLVEITPNAGWVDFGADGRPDPVANLSSKTCERLERFARSDGTAPIDEGTAMALVTLAHESFHLAGVTNEAEAQCYAIQMTEFTTERLGGSVRNARAAALWALSASPSVLPAEYWDPIRCRDAGPWDLRPDSAAWPS